MKTLYVKNRILWREWLTTNSQLPEDEQAREIWLIYYKKNSGKPRISYEDAVCEALCFGWIDGKVGTLDDKRYIQRFTPRTPQSFWSALNIKRAKSLIAEGKMMPSGMRAFRPEKKTERLPLSLTTEPESKFRKAEAAWTKFQSFPPYYQRMCIGWVASAKKEETQMKRLQKLIDFSAEGLRIKFM